MPRPAWPDDRDATGLPAGLSRLKRRGKTTAAEHLASLAKDPAFLAMRARKEAELAAFAATFADEEALIAGEAAAVGYQIESVWDFVNNRADPILKPKFTGSYERAYPLLVRHLAVKHHPRVREGIVRALTVKDGGEAVWAALLQQLRTEPDPALKWVLANALRTAMPYKVRRKHPEIAATYRETAGTRM
jgi:hypothetical protein